MGVSINNLCCILIYAQIFSSNTILNTEGPMETLYLLHTG